MLQKTAFIAFLSNQQAAFRAIEGHKRLERFPQVKENEKDMQLVCRIFLNSFTILNTKFFWDCLSKIRAKANNLISFQNFIPGDHNFQQHLPAFLLALSMADILADCSEQAPSLRQ